MSRSSASSNDDAIDPERRPLLITLSAHALSSIGFGLSLIAMSIQWLLADSSLGGDRLIMNRSQLQRRLRSKAYDRLSLPPNYGSSIPRESRRRHAKRVTFASITVDSKSQEHKQTVSYISKRVDHDATSLTSVSTSILTVSSTVNQSVADKEDHSIAPSLLPFRETLTSPTTPRLSKHAKTASTGGDLLPSHARIEKSPERKLIWASRPKLVAHDSRSSSPVSRRLAELRLPSAPRGIPKPKRAQTVPIPQCSLFKGRNRRPEPVPRTLPYEAPYFAKPPEPIRQYVD